MHQRQPQIRLCIRRPRHLAIIIQIMMRIIHAGGRNPHRTHLKLQPPMRGILPSVLNKRRPHALPRQFHPRSLPLFPHHIRQRIHHGRRVIIIRTKYKQARAPHERPQSSQRGRHRLQVRQIIPSIDHQIRLQLIQAGHPLLFGPLPRHHMQIRNMQQPELPLAPQCTRRQ